MTHQLLGPFAVQTHDAQGNLTGTLAAGVHYTCDGPTWAANTTKLTPYLATHAWPLQFVMMGDDPANPVNTYPLVFPDDPTAQSIIAQLA